jgi:hypothetical protein
VPALAGPFLAAAVLLMVAGAGKLVDPTPLVRALRSLSLPSGRRLVRAGAAAEVLVGAAAITTGSRAAAVAVAASYAVFTLVVLRGLARGAVLSSCGCFGKQDTPPTVTHAVVTGAAAAVAAVVAVHPIGPLPDLLGGQPGAGVPLLLAVAAVAATTYLVLAVLPLLTVRPGR